MTTLEDLDEIIFTILTRPHDWQWIVRDRQPLTPYDFLVVIESLRSDTFRHLARIVDIARSHGYPRLALADALLAGVDAGDAEAAGALKRVRQIYDERKARAH